MSFWSGLAKNALGFIPGVGPAIGMALDAAGSLSKGMGAGREKENTAATGAADFQLQERRAAEQAAQQRAQIDMQRKQQTQQSQSAAYKQALQSALGMNMKDARMNRPEGIPTLAFSGGSRPSALGVEGQAAAAQMNKLAQAKLMAGGDQFDAMAPIERTAPAAYKKPGFWENSLGAAGMVGGALGGAQAQAQQSDFQSELMKKIQALTASKGQGADGGGF